MLYDPKWKQRKTVKTLPQIYMEAADAIRKHGHSRGQLKAADGSMCVWGAISLVAEGNPLKASFQTRAMLAPLSKIVGKNVVSWNNEEARTKRQVLGLLRKAARSVPNGER